MVLETDPNTITYEEVMALVNKSVSRLSTSKPLKKKASVYYNLVKENGAYCTIGVRTTSYCYNE